MSSEIKESVPSAPDSYATNKTFAELGVAPELVAVLSSQGISTAFPIQARKQFRFAQHFIEDRKICRDSPL